MIQKNKKRDNNRQGILEKSKKFSGDIKNSKDML